MGGEPVGTVTRSSNSPWDRGTSPTHQSPMPTYIRLTTLTKEGQKHIEDSAKRTDQMRELAAEKGGTIEDVFLTLGEWDFVTVAEFPDDKSYAEFALKAAAGGEYEAKTLKALEEDDYVSIIESL